MFDMRDIFSQDKKEDENSGLPVYMTKAKTHALGPQEIGQFTKRQSAPQMSMPSGGGGGMPIRGGAPAPPTGGGGISLPGKKPGKSDTPSLPDYEMKTPDFSGIPNYTGADPWDPKHYEGIFVDPNNPIWGDIQTGLQDLINPVFDPSNYEGLFDGSLSGGNPVFDPGAYEGTLYNPDDPFGLNTPGAGAGEGLMGNIGDLASLIGIGKGIYGLTQGSGGQGGVDLATGIGGYFLPAVGVMKGIFDAAIGVGQYVKGRGRQYDYFHPALNQYATDKTGNTLMNLNFYDDISDAQGRGLDLSANWGNYENPYDVMGNSGWKNSNLVGIDNETGTMYWMNGDMSDYLGEQSYFDYLRESGITDDDILTDIVGMSGNVTPMVQAQNMGLMSETEWNQRLQDTFLSSIANNGIDFSNPAFSKVNMGNFKGQLVTDIGGTGENADHLLRIAELAGLMNNAGDGMDLSQYAGYTRPDDASYGHSPSKDWLKFQDELAQYADMGV